MDTSTIINFRPPSPFNFSYGGCEELRNECGKKLQSFFSQNAILWRRPHRPFTFPLDIKLTFRFIPFAADRLMCTFNDKMWEDISFLNFYFINPLSVEDYKIFWRSQLCEWIAVLKEIECNEWIIVFDSTRARQNKTRGPLIEKIKKDFSKFAKKIIEVCDESDHCFNALQNLVQLSLFDAMNYFASHYENMLNHYKEHFDQTEISFIELCGLQINLSQFYYSIGIIEQSLAIFDELDALLSFIVSHYSSTCSSLSWLQSTDSFEVACPLILAMMQYSKLDHIVSIIDLRCLILANQILNSFRVYQDRIQKTSQENFDEEEVKLDFAAIILRYSHHCVSNVSENIHSLKLNIDRNKVSCWTIAFCVEVSQFTSLLIDTNYVRRATYSACSLSVLKCNAIAQLGRGRSFSVFQSMSGWFLKGTEGCCDISNYSNAVAELKHAFSNKQQFNHYMQKYHEGSIELLKHFGWKRQSKLLGWQLANFLISWDRFEGALPYLLKFVNGLISDNCFPTLLASVMRLVVVHLETNTDLYFKEILNCYILLSIHSNKRDEQMLFTEKLFRLIGSNQLPKIKYFSWHSERTLPLIVHVQHHLERTNFLESLSTNNHHLSWISGPPGALLRLTLEIWNRMPLAITSYRLRAIFSVFTRSESKSSKVLGGRYPHFECVYNHPEGVSRLSCTWKGDSNSSIKIDTINGENSVELIDNDLHRLLIFESSENENMSLVPGCTLVNLFAKNSKTGAYLLECIEVEIKSSLSITFNWADVKEVARNLSLRPMCFIQHQNINVKLKPVPGLYAGVCQQVEVEFINGSQCKGESYAVIGTSDSEGNNDVEFWDEEDRCWKKKAVVRVEKSEVGDCWCSSVYICKMLRDLIKANPDRQCFAYFQEICIEWMEKKWKFSLEFLPLMNVSISLSILEQRNLYELRIIRPWNDGWIINPSEVTFIKMNDDYASPAEFLNPKLAKISPRSTHRFVWVVPFCKDQKSDDDIYHLNLTYTISPVERDRCTIPEEIYWRSYVFSDQTAISVKAPSFELCAQLLSSYPGATLCRVDTECDMIVSLRSLMNRVETVVISLESDPVYWSIRDKHKFLYVKESGLGQTSFSVIPKTIGFLPYPAICVYRCAAGEGSDKFGIVAGREENGDFGEKASIFVRTNGKQVHVLGPFTSSAEQRISEKSGRLKVAKHRLTKLFE